MLGRVNGRLSKALVLEALLLLGLLLLLTLEVTLLLIDLGSWRGWSTLLLLLLWLATKGVLRVDWSAKWVLTLLLLLLWLLLLTTKGILLLWLSPLTTLLLLLLLRWALLGLLVGNWRSLLLLLLLGVDGTTKALRIRLLSKVVPHVGSSGHLLLLLWRSLLLGLTAEALLSTTEGLRRSHWLVVSRSCPSLSLLTRVSRRRLRFVYPKIVPHVVTLGLLRLVLGRGTTSKGIKAAWLLLRGVGGLAKGVEWVSLFAWLIGRPKLLVLGLIGTLATKGVEARASVSLLTTSWGHCEGVIRRTTAKRISTEAASTFILVAHWIFGRQI